MTRRSRPSRLALLAAGVLTAVPLLGGCGFNYNTDRINTISAGVNEREGSVDILGAVVVANQDDVGVFAATFVNNDLESEASFASVALEGEEFTLEDPAAGTVPPGGRVSLFQVGGAQIEGDFMAGDFLDLTISFDNGDSFTRSVPVVEACRQYAPERIPGLELPEPPATEGETGLETTESGEGGEATGEGEEDLPPMYSCQAAPFVDPHSEE